MARHREQEDHRNLCHIPRSCTVDGAANQYKATSGIDRFAEKRRDMSDTTKQTTVDSPDSQEITGHYAKLGIHLHDPWEALPAFQMMRNLARQNGFSDVEDILITVDVTFYGNKEDTDAERLVWQIDDQWLGMEYKFTPRYRKERLEDMPTE